ncbi:MAG TPA: hypothetical protein VFS18_01675, partial [Actinomycetota bacterium]|nr:hypothetical protein [Actinomycetota bacterium]
TQALPPVEPAADLEEEVDRMSERVERLRALEFEKDVTIDLARPDEVAERVQELQLENYGVRQRERDEQTLLALGAIPEGTDVEDLLEDLATGILGFYVPEDEELMVGSGADDLTVNARLTLAHELEHALADQTFGLPLEDNVPGRELDASLAARALIEGDATLLTQHYAMTSVTTEEANDLLDDPALQAAIDAGERLPHAIRRASEFPYVQGLAFVCDLYGEGGWDAVDAAYEELPTTTAQIMFPERYRSGEGAIEPEPPGEVREEGWSLGDRSAFGAADLMLLFEAPGNDTDAALPSALTAASGWAGGTLHLWEGAGEVALGVSLVERENGDRLCASMQTWYQRAFPNDDHLAGVGEEKLVSRGTQQDAVLRCSGATVRLGIGPDASIARDLTR